MATIIICDNFGNPTGEYVEKEIGHTGDGKHHLAITVLLLNRDGQVLLQKRKHQRFDKLWDLTGATDLYHLDNGRDETFEEATLRCLKKEYGIEQVGNLKNLGGFNYFAPYQTVQGDFCENEYCVLMVGEYEGEVKMNPEVGYEYKRVNKEDFIKDIQANPQNYTPWAKEAVKLLKQMFLG